MPDGAMGVPDGGMTPDAGRTNTVSGDVLDGGPTYIGIGATNPGGGPIPTASSAPTAGATPFWATPKFGLWASGAVVGLAKAARLGGQTWSLTLGETTLGLAEIEAGATLTAVGIGGSMFLPALALPALSILPSPPRIPDYPSAGVPSPAGVYGPSAGSYGGGGTFQRDYIGGFGYGYPDLGPTVPLALPSNLPPSYVPQSGPPQGGTQTQIPPSFGVPSGSGGSPMGTSLPGNFDFPTATQVFGSGTGVATGLGVEPSPGGGGGGGGTAAMTAGAMMTAIAITPEDVAFPPEMNAFRTRARTPPQCRLRLSTEGFHLTLSVTSICLHHSLGSDGHHHSSHFRIQSTRSWSAPQRWTAGR